MTDATDLLAERHTTHGDFTLNAIYAQELRSLFRSASGWSTMPTVQREALDMIATKMSRILSGQSEYEDHWADVVGYGELARKACRLHQEIDRQFGVDLHKETR